MNPLDMRTIVLGYIFTNTICAWFVLMLWRQSRDRFAGTAFLVFDFVFQAVALVLVVMRGSIPDWISMIISNTMVIVGAILGFMGLERFVGKKGPQIHNYLLIIIFIMVHSYFVFVMPSLAARNLNFAVALLLICFQSAWLMWRRVEPGLRSLTYWVGLVYVLYCLVSMARIAHYFAMPTAENNYFQPSLFEAVILLSYQMLFIALTYCLVLMVNRRLLMDISIQEEKFSTAFHSAPYAITLTNLPDGTIIDVNDGFVALTGYERTEVLGKKSVDLRIWDNLEDRTTITKALLETGRLNGLELRFRNKKGDALTGLFSAEIITIDGEKSILSSISDITERTQLHGKLQDSETRFRQLANSTWEGILIHRDGIILDWNQALLDMFGYGAEEAMGKNVLDLIAPEFNEKAVQLLKQGAQLSVLRFEGKGRKKDGTIFPVEALGRPITHNSLPARVIAVRDMTEQKQVEADREYFEAQSRQLQKTESLGRMAGAIAHHFNNQLGVVIGNLEMAIEDLPKGSEPVNSLTSAMQAAGKAVEMSGLMLTYLGQSVDKRESLLLSVACIRSLTMLRAALPRNVAMETDLPTPGPVISANTNQIQQALSNLVTNAWEAIGEVQGSIHISVKTVSPAAIPTAHRFHIGWQPKNHDYACLEIRDTGVGIADKDIEKIFDPFFSTKFTGRGMGLAVVVGIVRSHGGAITVEAKPRHGSTFRVFFPMDWEEVHLPSNKDVNEGEVLICSESPLKMEEGGTVLLIEDEEMLRNMAAAMLKRLGFSVLEAKDGVEALEMFQQHQDEVICVFSDLTMPRMNGWETLMALRKLAPDIPVILASGYDKAHVMAGDHPELPQVFLGKPYKLKGLSGAINQALTFGSQ